MKIVGQKVGFERLYLRWKFFLKSRNILKDDKVIEKYLRFYENEINKTTNKIWFKYNFIYQQASFTIQDIRSIAMTHVISYVGLFSFAYNPKKLEEYKQEFLDKHGQEPTQDDLDKKDRINCVSFLNHRFIELYRYCFRVIQGSTIAPMQPFYFKTNKLHKFIKESDLVNNYSKYNYTPISKSEYLKMQRISRVFKQTTFEFNGTYYIRVKSCVSKLQKTDLDDLEIIPNESSLHAISPEDILINKESELELKSVKYKVQRLRASKYVINEKDKLSIVRKLLNK
jgi:hypothetical protein